MSEHVMQQERSPELRVITEAHFFEPYKKDLQELFTALGRKDKWSDDPRDILGYVRSGWIGAEHGNSAVKDQFTTEQQAAALPYFGRLGLAGETLPPADTHFVDAIVVGGTMQANYRRESVVHKVIEERGATTDQITLWMGQRPKEARDGTLEELLSTEGRFAGNDITGNSWVRHQLATRTWKAENPWAAQFATETDLGRVAMNKLVPGGGGLLPHEISLEIVDLQDPQAKLRPKLPDVPSRLITDYKYEAPDSQSIVVMNAAAVPRGEGRPSRHTTASCAREWLERHAPVENGKVLFVSSNPHTLRTAQDVYGVLREEGRGDIELVVAGASAPGNATTQLYLGEVGRLIDNDVRRNYRVKR